MNENLFAPSVSNSDSDWVTAHCDGGSRGNPGPAGYGALIEDAQGSVLAELSKYVGIQTNNFAEYSGLLGVLKWAVQHNVDRLRVISDSELMVKQMQGKYKVASPILRPLFEEARRLSHRIEAFEIRHTLRAGNKDADRLANEAMDKGMGRKPAPPLMGAVKLSGVGTVAKPAASKSGSETIQRFAGEPADGVSANTRQPDVKVGSETIKRFTSEPVSAGSKVGAVRRAAAPVNYPISEPASAVPMRPVQTRAPKHNLQVLEGYVKGGVVHLLKGELPEGVFVKVIYE